MAAVNREKCYKFSVRHHFTNFLVDVINILCELHGKVGAANAERICSYLNLLNKSDHKRVSNLQHRIYGLELS